MKIAMVGSGAAGSVFASYLRAGGADMTLIDPYKAHMDAVRDNGMKFTIYPDKTTVLTGFHTAYSADEVDVMDIVIFMTKANQLESAIQGAKHCIGPNTVLVSLINGLGNDDKLLKYYPASRCMVGSGVIGTALDGPGGCISTPSEGVIMNFGALENNELTVAAGKHMEECFKQGGCEGRLPRRRPPLHLEEGHRQLHRQHRLRRHQAQDWLRRAEPLGPEALPQRYPRVLRRRQREGRQDGRRRVHRRRPSAHHRQHLRLLSQHGAGYAL